LDTDPPLRPDLAAELGALIDRDESVRARLAAEGTLFDGYAPAMEEVHRQNAARLGAIVAEVGWPGRTLVGIAAASAAWRIVRHAIGEPDFMRAMWPVLAVAKAAGEVAPHEVAMLEDRIRVREGRAQRFGTQFDWDASLAFPTPTNGVEDPASVDERRAEVGLPPLEWRRPPPPGEPPPRDWAARQLEMEAWAVRVGWRRSAR
jgi:hypothetical protein